MKILFMGTPSFAAMSLQRLYNDGYEITGVITQPDKPRSRGMKVSFSPVKELALAWGTPVFQPGSLKDEETQAVLNDLKCDIAVVVAYGKLLPREILEMPPLGCVNIHASLLPKYRGAAPIQWAVLNGDRETGVTSMYMTEELDAGDILLSKKTLIDENETAGDLSERLSLLGAELICETIESISLRNVRRIPQACSEATFAPLLNKGMSPIDWSESALSIKCKVRGLNPWPVATAQLGKNVYKIFSVDISSNHTKEEPGKILNTVKSGIEIACIDGTVIIKELQAPGGKRMAAADFLRGHSISV